MRLLLDQNMSASLADVLRARGYDAVHTREVGLATAEDETILDWCRAEHRTVITMDADFHALLATSSALTPSVIRVRIEGLPDEQMAALIDQLKTNFTREFAQGAAITIKESSIRLHLLPLLPKER
jgi:predicted nuclease of predicted toxin-antitoxin system